jgi:hypothetical protein
VPNETIDGILVSMIDFVKKEKNRMLPARH